MFCSVVVLLVEIQHKDVKYTQLIPLTIFCPPGPLPFKNDSVNSSSLGGFGRSGIFFAHCAAETVIPRVVFKPCSSNRLPFAAGKILRNIVYFVNGTGRNSVASPTLGSLKVQTSIIGDTSTIADTDTTLGEPGFRPCQIRNHHFSLHPS